MPWCRALLLGGVQGLTEFWPVSSSAHIALLQTLFGWGEPRLSFTAAMHAGTFLAVLVFYRGKVLELLRAFPGLLRERDFGGDPHRRLLMMLAVAFLPALTIGFFASGSSEMMEGMPLLMALALLAFTPVMAAADRVGGRRRLHSLGWRGALVIGIFQALSMIPGVSRSGATIAAGLFLGLGREEAVEFSFLLSLPTTGAALLLSLAQMAAVGAGEAGAGAVLVGVGSSFLIGLFAVRFLSGWARGHDFTPFIIYRLALGAALLALLALGHVCA